MNEKDLIKAARRIDRAWTDKGSHPKYHDEQIRRLAYYWPELFVSIRDLRHALNAADDDADGSTRK